MDSILTSVCDALPNDKIVGSVIQEKPVYFGVSDVKPTYNVFQIRVQTKAGSQWEVERRVRALCIEALAKNGISQSDVTAIAPEV